MKRIWAIFFALISLLFGVTTSHAALYFPHVDTSVNQWQTEICVINPSSTGTVQGNLESYSNGGTIVATTPLFLEPGARKQIDVGAELSNASTTGYIVFQNTSGSPVGYTKFTQVNGDRVAIPAVSDANTGNTYITHIDWVPWWTGVSVVNTTTENKTLTIRFNTNQTRTVNLAPKEHQAFTIAQLFDNLIDTEIKSAVIENASGIVGLELFGNLPGLGKQLGGVPLVSKTATTLFYPHVDSTPGQWWTGVVAYNPSASTIAQVTVNSYDANGGLLGSSALSIGPLQKLVGLSNGTELNLPAGTAWFSLQSQIPLVGFELFGTANSNSLAGYSSVDLERKSGLFPKVEKNGWTGIAFVNTENEQATVNLTAYQDSGAVVATGTKTLNAHQKWVGYPVDPNAAMSLFPPGTNLNAATYISFSADRNVAGFQLNGSGGTILDALPALPSQQTSSSSGAQQVIDKALDLFKYQATLESGMQAVTDIMGQIFSDEGGTCPQVTIVPPIEQIMEAIPSAIHFTANYGSGCTPSGTTDVVSGQVQLDITGITGNLDSGMSIDFSLTATNLTQNGVVVMNGSVSGNIAFNVSNEVLTQATVTINFNNFQVADSVMSGGLTVSATNITAGETLDVGTVTITFNNLTAAGYTVTSGTATLTNTGSDTFQLVANLDTSEGAVNMTLTVQTPTETRIIVSTPTPGTISGYTVTLNNVIADTEVCDGYPSGGSVTSSQGGDTATVTFTPSCPALQMRDQISPKHDPDPSHNLNPWIDFSKNFYNYLKAKR